MNSFDLHGVRTGFGGDRNCRFLWAWMPR